MEKRCYGCGRLLTKDEIGINRKLIDPEMEEFQCLDCLAQELDTTAEILLMKIEEFKEDGCTLFS